MIGKTASLIGMAKITSQFRISIAGEGRIRVNLAILQARPRLANQAGLIQGATVPERATPLLHLMDLMDLMRAHLAVLFWFELSLGPLTPNHR